MDSHAHLYPCFGTDVFLASAAGNFAVASARMRLGAGAVGCLVLTEAQGCSYFEQLRSGTLAGAPPAWSIVRTSEKSSLVVTIGGEVRLVILAGKQLRTREDLEILALGCLEPIPDGLPIEEALALAGRHGFATVLPWGFGKWRFRRRRVVEAVLKEGERARLFVGDNGNRPRLFPPPRTFRLAAERGIPILPGSDPLPVASHATRAGGSGVFLPCLPDLVAPARQIAALLRTGPQPESFSAPEPLRRFLHAQVQMQVQKRFRPSYARRRSPESAAA